MTLKLVGALLDAIGQVSRRNGAIGEITGHPALENAAAVLPLLG